MTVSPHQQLVVHNFGHFINFIHDNVHSSQLSTLFMVKAAVCHNLCPVVHPQLTMYSQQNVLLIFKREYFHR